MNETEGSKLDPVLNPTLTQATHTKTYPIEKKEHTGRKVIARVKEWHQDGGWSPPGVKRGKEEGKGK